MNFLEGGEGREGDGGRGGRERMDEGEGVEGGRDDYYTYSNSMFNSNPMIPTIFK